VTVLGVAAAAVSPVWPAAAGVLAWVAGWPAWWLVLVAHAGASVPVASLDWLSGWRGALSLAAVIAGAWLAARHPRARVVALVLVLAAGAGALPIRWLPGGWPPTGAVVVACDVGQGDAIVLLDADGSAVVVDAGPDPEPVDACLRRLGVSTVDVVVISHFHADHIGGLDGVLAGRAVGAIVVPTFDEPDFGEALVRATARARTVPVVEVGAGWSFHDGEVELIALAPDRPLVGTRSDPNNNSLVLLARARGIAILLLGDAEVEQQVALLRDAGPSDLRVEILKVAHHGSSYQDMDLIAATGARVALVSAGAGNSYGHPHPALLGSLAQAGMTVLRTDENGDVAVVLTTEGLGVVASRGRA
jgi:competence protein ComEC